MRVGRVILAVLMTAGWSAVPSGAAYAAPAPIRRYHAVELGIVGYATAINDHGQIVGEGSFPSGGNRPFLVENGRAIDLGLVPGDTFGMARDINNRGQVIGISWHYEGDDGPTVMHTFRWENGRLTQLRVPGDPEFTAEAINDRGQIVGGGSQGSYLLDHGTVTRLGMVPFDINNRGQVVGTSDFGTDRRHACLWERGRLTNLDTGATPWTEAIAVNDQGWITGDSPEYALTHAFVRHDGVVTDIGSLGGTNTVILDINERGQVLGNGDTGGEGGHAFIWQAGRMIDLTPYGMPEYPNIYDFNDRAEIVGYAFTDNVQAVVYR